MLLTIGELARRSGLTVRTLHHYDAIGLLVPKMRSGAGYRLYGADDIECLHRILALRQMGLSLTDIGTVLSDPDPQPLTELIDQQIERLDAERRQAMRLRARLVSLRNQLVAGQSLDPADWLDTLEHMTMYEKYFSPEELEHLPLHHDPDVQAQWSALVASMREAIDRGARPGDPDIGILALRWMKMLDRDTNHNPDFVMRLNAMAANEPEARQISGITETMQTFVEQTLIAAHLAIFERYLTSADMQRMRANYGKQMYAWLPVIAELRQAMANEEPADGPHTQQLARRWMTLFRTYAGDDPATHQRIREAYANEPDLRSGSTVDGELFAYVRQSLDSLGS